MLYEYTVTCNELFKCVVLNCDLVLHDSTNVDGVHLNAINVIYQYSIVCYRLVKIVHKHVRLMRVKCCDGILFVKWFMVKLEKH